MIDSEILTTIGWTTADRVTGAYQRMLANGADQTTMHRVLVDMLVSGRAGAAVDGEAMALRQLEEMGLTIAAQTDVRAKNRAQRNAATIQAGADRDRFTKGIAVILDETDEDIIQMKLSRMARSEAIDAARDTTTATMRRSRLTTGWVRQLDADPCELCVWWGRDGRVWPASHAIPTHKGCACAQRWVREHDISIRDVSARAQAASDRRTNTTIERNA